MIAIDNSALQPAMDECAAALKVAGVVLPRPLLEAVTRRTIRGYVAKQREFRAGPQHTPHPDTVALSQLGVGEFFERPAMFDKSAWRNRMRTARGLMKNPKARWVLGTVDGNHRLLRLEDGATPRRDPRMNLHAVFLSNIAPGSSQIAPDWPNVHFMGTNMKTQARRIVGYPYANWSAKTTPEGIVVRRVR